MIRDEMIAVLVCDTLERVMIMRQVFWLQGILESGFVGFSQWSDEELRCEMRGRGLDPGNSADDAGDDDSADRQDGEEFMRYAGYSSAEGRLHYLQD